MIEQATKIFSVFFISMLKFIGGPLSATALGLRPLETIFVCIAGMMTSVAVFSVFGKWLKINVLDKYRKPLLFSPRNRKIVSLWNRFGIKGIAFLTPIFLTPIGGTIIATSFGESKKNIYVFMLISATFWAVALTFTFSFFKYMLVK